MKDIHARVKSAQGGTFVPCPIAYKEGVEDKVVVTHHNPKHVTCPWCLGYISGRLGAENKVKELRRALEVAAQDLGNLGRGDLTGDARMIALNASDNAKKASVIK